MLCYGLDEHAIVALLQEGERIFVSKAMSMLGHIQPPVHRVLGLLPQGQQPGQEANHPYTAKHQYESNYTPNPTDAFMCALKCNFTYILKNEGFYH
jgi:hypothetical protein